MKYNPKEIEAYWQKNWAATKPFAASNNSTKPKYYVLDMFPYPSGAGLHVGHPLGYIASDIVARYKRHKGFNVLHPQGYDSFGLPAEQYAIQTGQHPDKTTKENIARYREQLDRIGFSFDWSREVRTSNADYYKHTQWIFIQLFNSWYNKNTDKAEDISTLIAAFEKEGNQTIDAVCDDNIIDFSATDWNTFSDIEKQKILLQYRLTYLAETEVNWCAALGTVLANDEIVNGVSERGGHPVIRKKMTQWSMRISAYAERLLTGLDTIDWSESIKESQRNWIGKSVGAKVVFNVQCSVFSVEVFTTRPDTLFGVTFMTLAPEHPLVIEITTAGQKQAVEKYIEATAKRSERERMADVKTISGVFTGAYAEHPFTKEPIPVWIGDYVLAGYGTGAVMAVPAGDERDFAFAKHFDLPIKNIFSPHTSESELAKQTPEGGTDVSDDIISKEAFVKKEGFILKNSDFLNGLNYKEATKKIITELEAINQGKGKINYRLRDTVFSRQRYWGEPFPVYYVDGLPQMIDPKHLPIKLPEVEKYLPTEDGLPPLGNAKEWHWSPPTTDGGGGIVSKEVWENSPFGGGGGLELNTMPGWAGSSWYWMRYMDAHNDNEFCSQDALKYWQNVDLYIGGSEHATGHLLYSRFWNKFLKDRGYAPTEEPFKKLINQGMILGNSAFVYKVHFNSWQEAFIEETIDDYKTVFLVSVGHVNDLKKLKTKIFNLELSKELKKDFTDGKSGRKDLELIKYLIDGYIPFTNEMDEEVILKNLTKKDLEVLKLNLNIIEKGREMYAFHYPNKGVMMNGFHLHQKHVDLSCINDITNELDIEKFKNHPLYSDYKNAEFILDDGSIHGSDSSPSGRSGGAFIVGREVEKMSKSKYNVVNPDDICNEYGADTLRLYEMFLGPLEQSKPWNTAGISGVFGFLKKLWRLYFNEDDFIVTDNEPSKESLKTLHKTIKKCTEDIENFSFNTSVSQFMICVNELSAQNCHERAILEPLAILISPYAPHIAEELWCKLKNLKIEECKDYKGISYQPFPIFDEKYLIESDKEYPVSFNGKMRFTINLPLDLTVPQIEEIIMKDERTIKQLDGSVPKKVIIVPGKVINLVG